MTQVLAGEGTVPEPWAGFGRTASASGGQADGDASRGPALRRGRGRRLHPHGPAPSRGSVDPDVAPSEP